MVGFTLEMRWRYPSSPFSSFLFFVLFFLGGGGLFDALQSHGSTVHERKDCVCRHSSSLTGFSYTNEFL